MYCQVRLRALTRVRLANSAISTPSLRESVRNGGYKALSESGNPSFAAVMRIARALGMRVRITA